MPTGVHVKLLGWIKNAVGFVKVPAGPSTVEPSPAAPHAIDDRTPPEDASTDGISAREISADAVNNDEINIVAAEPENRTESPIEVAPEIRIRIEPEAPTSVGPQSRTTVEPESAPDQQEIDRRRGMVRAFFNDYWSSADDKPASFADRLDRAEAYINERAAAGGESWQLGPATRKQLGLPPSKKR
jgi:hypothetical protein